MEIHTLVLHRQTADPTVISVNRTLLQKGVNRFRFYWERFVIFIHNRFNRSTLFAVSLANTGTDLSRHPLIQQADLIHLHWINQGFLSLEDIKQLIRTGKPLVWTLHDMWACTSICHHSWGCDRFQETCGECPFLASHNPRDLSHRTWMKKRFLASSGIQWVAVSSWLAGQVRKSSLTRSLNVQVIPNVIDVSLFFPQEKAAMRQAFGLPLDKKIILMGAARLDEPIKGFSFLKEALSRLSGQRKDLLLVLFGTIRNPEPFFHALTVPCQSLGLITDPARVAQLYSAADVTVVPSYYETFGQTLSEAMACGCPVVSFNNSGQTDVIDHKVNGYLAAYKDSGDLAKGIEWVLNYPDTETISKACVDKVRTHYSEQVVAEKYLELYRNLLS